MACELKTGEVWSLKNMLRIMWKFTSRDSVKVFFDYWSQIVERSGLPPIIRVKELLERHRNNIQNYFKP